MDRGGRPFVASVLAGAPSLLGALATALLVFWALPGHGHFAFGLCAYAPLILAIRGARASAAALYGALCGVVLQELMTAGLRDAMTDLFSLHPLAAGALHFLCCIVEGGRVALLAVLFVRLSAMRVPEPIAFVAALLASEVVWPAIFPVPLAIVATRAPVLLQVGSLLGEVGVSATLAAANAGCIALAVALRSAGRISFAALRPALGCAAVLGASAAFGAVRIDDLDARSARPARELAIAVVQANANDLDPWQRLARYAQRTQELARHGAPDLVVWGETVLTEALDEQVAAGWLEPRLTRKLRVPLVFGAALQKHGAVTPTFLNSALVSDAEGAIVGRYDKRVLVPFTEYVPGAERWPWLRQVLPSITEFAAGARPSQVTLGGMRIALSVCYEMIWPDAIRDAVLEDAPDVLVNLTNDRWFGPSLVPELHLHLAALRAVEHGRFVVRAADTGISAVIAPTGAIVARGELFQEATVRARIAPGGAVTPFSRIGNLPWRLLALAVLAAAFVRLPRRVRRAGPAPA